MRMNDPGLIPILQLIPQRAPMVMVDRITSVKGNAAISEFEIRKDNIFVKKGLFSESGVLENIAQTAAALNGYRALMKGESVKNGYIGGIKNLRVEALPSVVEILVTRIEEVNNVMGASIIEAESRVGNRIVARCEMKVFIEDE